MCRKSVRREVTPAEADAMIAHCCPLCRSNVLQRIVEASYYLELLIWALTHFSTGSSDIFDPSKKRSTLSLWLIRQKSVVERLPMFLWMSDVVNMVMTANLVKDKAILFAEVRVGLHPCA